MRLSNKDQQCAMAAVGAGDELLRGKPDCAI